MYTFVFNSMGKLSSLDTSQSIQQSLSLTNIRSNVYSKNAHYFLTASKKLEAANT